MAEARLALDLMDNGQRISSTSPPGPFRSIRFSSQIVYKQLIDVVIATEEDRCAHDLHPVNNNLSTINLSQSAVRVSLFPTFTHTHTHKAYDAKGRSYEESDRSLPV